MQRALRALTIASALAAAVTTMATAQEPPGGKPAPDAADRAEKHYQIPRQNWTFAGLFGYFDEQQLRRGYLVYKTVCANCHNLRLLSYRNLGEPGGPHFPKAEVEAIAAEVQVADGYNDQGEVNMRPGKPSDPFQWRFKNEKEAGLGFNGAVPPDLSLMVKARSVERDFAWYAFPLVMLEDLATQYQEQGADYIYALLTGYGDAPADFKLAEGLQYNKAFPGNQLAMPQPLQGKDVDYADGTPNALEQEVRDVTAFLTWAAEPHLVERKKLGIWVIVYLAVLAVLLLLAKRTLWRNVEH